MPVNSCKHAQTCLFRRAVYQSNASAFVSALKLYVLQKIVSNVGVKESVIRYDFSRFAELLGAKEAVWTIRVDQIKCVQWL